MAVDLHAGGQRALNVIQRGIQRPGQLDCVRSRLFLNSDDDGWIAIVGPFAAFERLADAHLA